MLDLSISVAPITDTKNYYYGKYLGIDVVMNKDGYINISKIISMYKINEKGDSNYSLNTWSRVFKNYQTLKAYAINEGFSTSAVDPPSDDKKAITKASKAILDKVAKEITVDDLNDIDKPMSNDIIGTYAPQFISNAVAMWVSTEFYIKVLKIAEEYTKRQTKRLLDEKDDTINDLNKKIENLEKLILKGQDEVKQECMSLQQQNVSLQQQMTENEEQSKQRHNELMGLINSAISFLDKEKPINREILLIYRLKEEPKNTLHIRAGKRSSFKIPKKDECSYLFIGEHISNAKRILRFLKDKDILPTNGSSSTYQIDSGSMRKKIYNIVGGVNDKYQELSKKTPK